MNKYDIFISYRRSSYDTANLIATRLKAAGYSVFFDIESLRSGLFNEQLYDVIDNCQDFLIILPENALDRCQNKEDWVRLEVCRAIEKQKNIIPVMLNGFSWPDPMPEGMESLRFYQSLTANSSEYFDLCMEKLQDKYLHSRRHLPISRLVKYSGIIVLTLASLVAIVFGIFSVLSKDVCTKYATIATTEANHVHALAEEQHKLNKDWEEFRNAIKYESHTDRIKAHQELMLNRIDLTKKNIQQFRNADTSKLEISDYNRLLMSIHGINSEEIAMIPVFSVIYNTDYINHLNNMRLAVSSLESLRLEMISAENASLQHSFNFYYASLLSELTDFPKGSLRSFNETSQQWTYFPIQLYKIGEDKEYYERIINTEAELAEKELSRFSSVMKIQDAEMDDIIRKNNELETLVNNNIEKFTKQSDSTRAIIESSKEELSTRKEKTGTKELFSEAPKAELENLDKQYKQSYETMIQKCHIKEGEDEFANWGKIRLWGQFISMLVNSRKALNEEGITLSTSVTPSLAYSNMESMLDQFQTYYPQSVRYIPSAKHFFKQLSLGEIDYGGVLIFCFKDNHEHPIFKEGDIIIGYNGNAITDYANLNSEYKKDNNGLVTYLRMSNGKFDKHTNPIENVGIVSFLDLTNMPINAQ